jgi:hypothetical protein
VNRMIAAVMVALIAVLAAIGLVTGGDDGDEEHASASEPSVAAIARGVERVRQLQFDNLPRVRHVTGAQARAFGLRELDRETTPEEVAAEERLLTLVGLLPEDSSLRSLLGKTLSTEVGGFYDPDSGTLAIVGEGGSGLLREITLAHELTHGLEDQSFGLETTPGAGFERDLALARSGLHEGSATIAMVDYVVLKQTGRARVPASLRDPVLKALGNTTVPASSGLPRYLREGLVFPYAAGARLVNAIQDRGGWAAVDRAFQEDAPVSSEQIMHPAKYFAHERPQRIRVRAPRGTELVQRGDFGEFDTEQLLLEGNPRPRAEAAAAGWGGGGYALWRRGDRYGVTLRWTWDSARDAVDFARALRRTARRLGGQASGSVLTVRG